MIAFGTLVYFHVRLANNNLRNVCNVWFNFPQHYIKTQLKTITNIFSYFNLIYLDNSLFFNQSSDNNLLFNMLFIFVHLYQLLCNIFNILKFKIRILYMCVGYSKCTAICQREIRSRTQRNRLSDHTVLHSVLLILTYTRESFFTYVKENSL